MRFHPLLRKLRRLELTAFVVLCFRGLDNAGKTTILKQLNGEDIRTVSPTLGFEIRTFGHKGYGPWLFRLARRVLTEALTRPSSARLTRSYTLNVCQSSSCILLFSERASLTYA